ncbi:MAG: imidazoleglycerol-phosphate dehydratase [Rickettsiaceae bacterium]|jgi:imidazoleglycerol-phosphate dehydratase|nr:imidazoleglycerol-phosphate dehydratase [Rickettsiaceae bacterium]
MGRAAEVTRNTKETKIAVKVNLDGNGQHNISTGIGFLDHMMEQISCHSLIDIDMKIEGDLHVDFHHTTEDCAIALGSAIKKALDDKKGIARFGFFYVPMDETLTRVVIDICGRAYPVWNVDLKIEKVGNMDTELFREWFFAFANALGCNLHVENLYGINSHHIVESCFKGFAKALRIAVSLDERKAGQVISTKGVL